MVEELRGNEKRPAPVKITKPRLVPVIELEPGRFGSAPSPSGPWSQEQSERYWRACLWGSGLGFLNPVSKGSWFVTLASISTDDVLRTIIEKQNHGVFTDALNDVSAMSGGLALFDGDQVLVEPQCCGDLSNLFDWRVAAAHRGEDREMLYIGHPWLTVSYRPPTLAIFEEEEYPDTSERRVYHLDPQELANSVVVAEAELRVFASRISEALRTLAVPGDRDSVASRMAGLNVD